MFETNIDFDEDLQNKSLSLLPGELFFLLPTDQAIDFLKRLTRKRTVQDIIKALSPPEATYPTGLSLSNTDPNMLLAKLLGGNEAAQSLAQAGRTSIN